MKLIFDSSALIPTSKYTVGKKRICEYLIEYVEIHIPSSVKNETVVHPDKFPSEATLQALISQGKIIVDSVQATTDEAKKILSGYTLGPGEQDAILLYLQNQQEFDTLIIDDYVAAMVCQRLQIDSMLLLDLFVQLGRKGKIPRDLAIKMICNVAPRYNLGFIKHSLLMLDEYKEIVARLEALEREVFELKQDMKDFRREMNERFDRINERFDRMNERFDRMNERFDQMYERIGSMMKWAIGILALFGTMITVLLAISQFVK
jgi:tetrahydromethanopterin S-methyltransferase subunit G